MFPFTELIFSPIGVGLLVLMLLLEWLTLVQIKWQPLFRALGDAAIASTVSAVVTLLLGQLLLALVNPLAVIVAAFALAVAVEGFVFMLIRKRKAAASLYGCIGCQYCVVSFSSLSSIYRSW